MQILTHPTQQETEKGTSAERFKGPGTLGMTCPFPPLWPWALPVHLPVQLVSVVNSPENQPGVGGGSWQDLHKKQPWWAYSITYLLYVLQEISHQSLLISFQQCLAHSKYLENHS